MKQVVLCLGVLLFAFLVAGNVNNTNPCAANSNAVVVLTANSGIFGCVNAGTFISSEWIISPGNGSILLEFDITELASGLAYLRILDGPNTAIINVLNPSPYTSFTDSVTVQFISDIYYGESTFSVTYTALGDPCLYSVNRIIDNPNFSCPIVGNVTSSWQVLGNSPYQLAITENGDFLITVQDGNSTSPVIYTHDKAAYVNSLYTSGNDFYISIVSHDSGGFLQISATNHNPCLGATSILTGSEAVLSCGPNAYSTGGSWDIVGNPGEVVELIFETLNLVGNDVIVVQDQFDLFTVNSQSGTTPPFLSLSSYVTISLFLTQPLTIIEISYQIVGNPCLTSSIITFTSNLQVFGCDVEIPYVQPTFVSGWLITPQDGDTISLVFAANSHFTNTLTIFDGVNNQTGLLYTVSDGRATTTPIISSGAAMYVQIEATEYDVFHFNAQYTTFVQPDPCTSNATITRYASYGTISCPSITTTNTQTLVSYWQITPGQGLITLDFSLFNLQPGATLNIFNGLVVTASPLDSFTGASLPPKTIFASENDVLIQLIVLPQGPIPGNSARAAPYTFALNYAAAGSPCAVSANVNLIAESGTFGCPTGFGSGIQSTWLVTPNNGPISYSFTQFNLLDGVYQQYINVYDGYNNSGILLESLTGYDNPQSRTTITDALFVELINVGGVSGLNEAFDIEYTTQGDICGNSTSVELTAPKGVFGCYSGLNNNISSSWLINPNNSIIALIFLKLDLENGFDYLEIHDGDSSAAPLLGNFTGDVFPIPNAFYSTGDVLYVKVNTDSTIESNGFEMAYVSGVGDPCLSDYNETLTSAIGEFGCPNGIQNSIYSYWLITVPPSQGIVVASFTDFSLELDFDFLYVYDGASSNSTLLASLTGSNLPDDITSTGRSLFFLLVTDSEIRSQGFYVKYTSLESDPCQSNQFITLTKNSDSFGCSEGSIANSIVSSWLISPDNQNIITLSFSVFNLRTGDFVRVYDGSSTLAPLLGSFTGATLPNFVVSTGSNLLVVLSTDSINPSIGFRASYNTNTADPCLTSEEVTLVTSSGTFGCPNGIRNNVDSSWLIAPLSNNRVQLTVEFLNLAAGDTLYVFDGSSTTSPILAALTGTSRLNVFTTTNSLALVVIVTDSTLESGGFVIDFVTALPPTPSISPFIPSATRSPVDFSFTSSISPLPITPSSSPASASPFVQTISATKSPTTVPSPSTIYQSIVPSVSSSITFSGTSSASVSAAVFLPSASNTPRPYKSIVPFSPSVNPSVTSSSLPIPVTTDVETLTVQLQCKTSGSSCCQNFATVWAQEENSQNYPNLISVQSCVYNSGLVTVVFDQYGSNYHSSIQILDAYWKSAGCKNQNPLDGKKCTVTTSSLSTSIWSVNYLIVDSFQASPSPLPSYFYYHKPASDASVLSSHTSILFLIATIVYLTFVI